MTSKVVVAVLGVVLSLSACYAQVRQQSDPPANAGGTDVMPDNTIKNLERELEAAITKGDAVALERILADDYFEIDARGGVKRKADVIALARAVSSKPRGESIGPEKTVDELMIREHGDCTLVSGRTTIRYQFMEYQTSPQPTTQNPVTVDQERFIRTYAKIGRRWQLIAWQTTAIPKR